jgi:hypothetical protein
MSLTGRGMLQTVENKVLRGIPSRRASATAFKQYTEAYHHALETRASPNGMLKLVVTDNN